MDLVSSLWLALLAFGAAVVNGAVGYGFSSIITPIAILWISNKVLNPALVLVELLVNVTLLLRERQYLRGTWPHARPVITTLLPGVILGTIGLAVLSITTVKFAVYATLLPLIIVQLIGISRPIRNERAAGNTIGPAIGFLYALTTISGPPLALFFRNQGLAKNEFRATIAQVRVAESSLTLTAYATVTVFFGGGLITLPALSLLPYLLIPVVIGVPIGALLLTRISADAFRKFVMNVDGVIVSYGFSQVLVALNWVNRSSSYLLLLILVITIISLTAFVVARPLSFGLGGPRSTAELVPPEAGVRVPGPDRP